MAQSFDNVRTLVVKIGTTLLGDEHGFDGRLLETVVQDLARLKHANGLNLLIVSSGAMGCGRPNSSMGMSSGPSSAIVGFSKRCCGLNIQPCSPAADTTCRH